MGRTAATLRVYPSPDLICNVLCEKKAGEKKAGEKKNRRKTRDTFTVLTPDILHAVLPATAWDDMFTLKLPLIEKILRPVLVYLALIVLLRVFGKRELAQLNPFDLVVLLSVSNTVQNAIIGDDNSLTGGIVGAVALFAINYTVVRFLFKHRRLDQILEGAPSVLIKNGQVDRRALSKELLSESELLTVAHRQGFDTLEEVDACVLEPGGVFFMKGRIPSTDSQRFETLLSRLADIDRKLALLERR
jgi:hypothetical protein